METVGVHYGRSDLERLGIFIEMPCMNGKGYVSPFPKPKITKGRNIMGSGRKLKNGTQHGYFDSEFRRLFVGEAISRTKRKKKEDEKKKKMPFRPPGYPKWHSCPGDFYGTFGGIVEALENELVPPPAREKPKRNFTTRPVKFGGPGYADTCLSRYPEYMANPYKAKLKVKEYGHIIGGPLNTTHFPKPYFEPNPYFHKGAKPGPTYVKPKDTFKDPEIGIGYMIPVGPAKWQGGCHAGCFDKWPEYISERQVKKKAGKKKKDELFELEEFHPQSMALKSMYTASVLARKTDLGINVTNYKTYEPKYVKYLVN